jgi:hypothetical protein
LEGAFLEIPKGLSSALDMPMRQTRRNPLGMTDSDCHAHHTKAALYPRSISSCFVAGAFPGYYCMGIKMLVDTFRNLLHPGLSEVWDGIGERG